MTNNVDTEMDGQELNPESMLSGYLSFLGIPPITQEQYGLYYFTSFEGYELFNLDSKQSIFQTVTSPNLWYGMVSESDKSREEKIATLRAQIKSQTFTLSADELSFLTDIFKKLNPPYLDYSILPDDPTYEMTMDGSTFIIDFPHTPKPSRLYWHGSTAEEFSKISDRYIKRCERALGLLRLFPGKQPPPEN